MARVHREWRNTSYIVSTDGNRHVAERKGFNAEKGNSVRPIYDWETRARAVASVTVPTIHGNYVPVADMVTMHDPLDLDNTPHRSLYDLAAFLKPDVWSVYSEPEDILEAAPQDPRLQHLAMVVIDNADNYFNDTLLKGRFSTSKIVKRIMEDI